MIKVVFFGTEDISLPTLQALIDSPDYQVVAVVTKPDSLRGRGYHLERPAAAVIADKNNIVCLQPAKLTDISKQLHDLQADIGALVSYGKIIPQSIIDLFPHGIVNFHPSMLPVYRGPSPIETAIMNGDRFTGLTLMQLSSEMDAGDIYYQEKVAIDPDSTTADLYSQFGQRGAELTVAKLSDVATGKLQGIKQDDELAIYCRMITKDDGRLNPESMTARQCYNRLRAFGAWPKCRIKLADTEVIVTKAKPLDDFTGDSWPDIITCRDNSALQLIEIVSPKSGRRMKVSDYLNGLNN